MDATRLINRIALAAQPLAGLKLPIVLVGMGVLTTLAGVLVVLAGTLHWFETGVDGQVTLAEGEATDTLRVDQHCQITAHWQGKPEQAPYCFGFDAGTADWGRSTTLDLGEVDGVAARVLRYYHRAILKEEWAADDTGAGGPLVRIKLEGPHGGSTEAHLLTDQDFGDELYAGPIRVQLRRAASQAMLDDFLTPPADLGSKGLLLAYHHDRVTQVAVAEYLGKKMVLDDSGLAIEIVAYLPNAKPGSDYQFRSAGEEPRNPLLELRVHEPGRKPLRQLAFAKSLLMSLDPMLGQACPVKFHYLHPGIKSETAAELIQTRDGKLYCRRFVDGKCIPDGEVTTGARLTMPSQFTLCLVEYLPHARQSITFEPKAGAGPPTEQYESAAEIEVCAGGVTQSIWLQRGNPLHAARSLVTPQGNLTVRLEHGEAPLGFSLKLVGLRKAVNPDGTSKTPIASVVRLLDPDRGIDEERVVTVSEPLSHNGLRFRQSGFDERGHGITTSTLRVEHTAGRPGQAMGWALVCLGTAIMFFAGRHRMVRRGA